MPQAYVCYTQANRLLQPALMIRIPLAPAGLASEVRSAVAAVDTKSQWSSRPWTRKWPNPWRGSAFKCRCWRVRRAGAATGCGGLYSVLSYLVAAGRGEIGIRMALGAQPLSVFRMIAGARYACPPSAPGSGSPGAWRCAHRRVALIRRRPQRPRHAGRRHRGIAGRGVRRQRLPALRAMRTDPVSALRED